MLKSRNVGGKVIILRVKSGVPLAFASALSAPGTTMPANTMWRNLLYSGSETCFGPSTQGAGIRYQNTSQIQILGHFEKKGRDVRI